MSPDLISRSSKPEITQLLLETTENPIEDVVPLLVLKISIRVLSGPTLVPAITVTPAMIGVLIAGTGEIASMIVILSEKAETYFPGAVALTFRR